MVNTGQPSAACFQCKNRRIKCDAGRPQCERCIKYGATCPGYPTAAPLVFRNDTERVRERAQRRYEKDKLRKKGAASSQPASKQVSSDSSENSECGASSSAPPRDIMKLQIAQSEQAGPVTQYSQSSFVQGAVAAFLTQWSIPDPDVLWGSFDAASDLYPTSAPDSCFRAALEALALITLSMPKDTKKYDVRRSAMSSYGKALQSINKALADPQQRISDHTFIAILFMFFFESLAEMDDYGDRGYRHMLGLMTMIQMRGKEQFDHPTGRRLFLSACFLWNMGAIPFSRPLKMPLPSEICDVLLNSNFGRHERAYHLLPLVDQSLHLRTDALEALRNHENPLDDEGLSALLSRIQASEKSLLEWHNRLPEGWAEGSHLYEILTLNIFRVHRIFLRDLDLRCHQQLNLLTGRSSYVAIAEDARLSRELVDEICATVPYGFANDDPRARKKNIKPAVVPKAEVTVVYHWAFSFPLLISSMVDCLPQAQKEGIQAARKEFVHSVGMEKPYRDFPVSKMAA